MTVFDSAQFLTVSILERDGENQRHAPSAHIRGTP